MCVAVANMILYLHNKKYCSKNKHFNILKINALCFEGWQKYPNKGIKIPLQGYKLFYV